MHRPSKSSAQKKTPTPAKKKEKVRPPKEWVIPANPKYYDIEHAFERLKSEYGIFAVRGPRGIPNSLSEALEK